MTLTTSRSGHVPAAGPRKSPLRTATMAALAPAAPEPTAADILLAAGRGQRGAVPAPELRRMQISEFAGWLRSCTNRHKRPFQEATVAADRVVGAGAGRRARVERPARCGPPTLAACRCPFL
jgi:hypothetical protein